MLSGDLPSLLSLELPGFDHCTLHHDAHPHLCFVHLPSMGVNAGALFVLLVFLGYAALRASFRHRCAGSGHCACCGPRMCETAGDLGVTIIETSQPLCLTAGLLRPRVLLSRGLSARSPTRIARSSRARTGARAAAGRADATIVPRCSRPLPSGSVARWLGREGRHRRRAACDEEAARAVDYRVAVASAILAVERAAQHAVRRSARARRGRLRTAPPRGAVEAPWPILRFRAITPAITAVAVAVAIVLLAQSRRAPPPHRVAALLRRL